MAFYQWLGVSDCPKVVNVGEYGNDYREWRSSDEYQEASRCLSGAHPKSQHLAASPSLDRLPPILDSGDRERLSVLWSLLVESWATIRSDIMCARWRCWNSANHTVSRNRDFVSPALYMLRNKPWVPAERSGQLVLVAPNRAWRSVPHDSGGAIEHLFTVAPGLRRPPADLGSDVGMLDPGQLAAPALAGLLVELEAEFADEDDLTDTVVDAARWLLRQMEEADDLSELEPHGVPLISTRGGTSSSIVPRSSSGIRCSPRCGVNR